MRNRLLYTGLFFLIVSILQYACRHEIINQNTGGGNSGGGNPPPAVGCNPDTAYFLNDILPLISSNCTMSGCHDNVTHADGVNLTTYINILKYVRPGNAAESKLYESILRTDHERMPPPPMPPFTTAQKNLVRKWIDQGARNNSCLGRCDTTVFTFSGAVKPIIDQKCIGCHNSSNLGGNINLSTYEFVKTVALNGKLFGSVAQQPGYSPMPKNGIKLPDCEIRQMQKWIAAGALNN